MGVRINHDTQTGWVMVEGDGLLDVLELPRPSRNVSHVVARLWEGHDDGTPSGWSGAASTLKEFAAYVAKGDPKAAERIRQLRDKMSLEVPPAKEIRRRSRWQDDGDEYDRDRAMNGDLERAWWGSAKMQRPSSPIVRVIVDICYGSGVHAETLFWSGAVAAAFADIAEEAGWRVEIVARAASSSTFKTGYSARGIEARWIVKDSSSPTDLNTVAASIANAAAFRIGGFALWCAAGGFYNATLTGSFGHCHNYRPDDMVEQDVFIPTIYSSGQAEAILRTAIAALNNRTIGGVS